MAVFEIVIPQSVVERQPFRGSPRVLSKEGVLVYVVRLAQPAGEDLQVVVNGVLVATGEVVIADDTTALRITHLTSTAYDQERA